MGLYIPADIKTKNPFQGIIQEGRWYKVRVGERSWIDGVFNTLHSAEKALRMYIQQVDNKNKKKKNG